MFVKINDNIIRKQNNLLQISVQDLYNDMILPISEGIFWLQEQFTENHVLEIRHLGSTFQNILNQRET